MLKLLYISAFVPYDKIRHGGGQTFNYYVNEILKENNIETTMVGFCRHEDKKFFDKDEMGLICYPITTRGTLLTNIRRVSKDLFGKIILHHKEELSYYLESELIKKIKKLKKKGYSPDVIILEWTSIVLEIDKVKKIFPDAKYIASEHDVSFLGLRRKWEQATDNKNRAEYLYNRMKEKELNALYKCDIAMPHNNKDKDLLISNGVPKEKIHVLTPYFHDMRNNERKKINHDILFWGAMHRPENYEAAIWFIDNVMPLLKDTDVRFVVAGNKPPEILKQRANDRIIITGYVQDEKEYFEQSMCFVSPLLTGAGIKIKVIEALSAKIPVLTNEIGIEGIQAIDGVSYFKCENALDYERVIRNILQGKENTSEIADAQVKVIEEYFNMNQSFLEYKEMIYNLGEKTI